MAAAGETAKAHPQTHGKFTAVEPSRSATFAVAKGISSSGDVVGYWAVNNENGEEIERHGFLFAPEVDLVEEPVS